MLTRALAAGVLAAGLLLTGCTTPAPSPSPTATEPEVVEPADPIAEVLAVSLDGVTVLNDDESVAAEAPFSDGQAVLDLLSELNGSTPEAETNSDGYPIVSYDFGALTLVVVTDAGASISIGDDEFAGLLVQTTEGIFVGSTRADAAAVAGYEGSDFDGDGLPDYLGLEARENPGTESLERPGESGTDFIMLVIEADVVTRIISPSSDYGDV